MTDNIRDLTQCPSCKSSWDAGDIYEELRKSQHYKNLTDAEVKKAASSYGWTEENPKSFSRLIGIEVMGKYDGISYWKCPDCNTYWDRWTNEIVTDFNEKQ